MFTKKFSANLFHDLELPRLVIQGLYTTHLAESGVLTQRTRAQGILCTRALESFIGLHLSFRNVLIVKLELQLQHR